MSNPTLLVWGRESTMTEDCKRLMKLPFREVVYHLSEKSLRGMCFSDVIEEIRNLDVNPTGCVICGTTFEFPYWSIPKGPLITGFDTTLDIKTPQGFWKVWINSVIPEYLRQGSLLGRIGRGSHRAFAAKNQKRKFQIISTHPNLGWNGTPKWISSAAMEYVCTNDSLRVALEKFKDYNIGEDIAFGLLFSAFSSKPICEIDIIKSRDGSAHKAEHNLDIKSRDRTYAALGKIIDDFYKQVGKGRTNSSGKERLLSRILHGAERKCQTKRNQ
jgi:hypothetical protein